MLQKNTCNNQFPNYKRKETILKSFFLDLNYLIWINYLIFKSLYMGEFKEINSWFLIRNHGAQKAVEWQSKCWKEKIVNQEFYGH